MLSHSPTVFSIQLSHKIKQTCIHPVLANLFIRNRIEGIIHAIKIYLFLVIFCSKMECCHILFLLNTHKSFIFVSLKRLLKIFRKMQFTQKDFKVAKIMKQHLNKTCCSYAQQINFIYFTNWSFFQGNVCRMPTVSRVLCVLAFKTSNSCFFILNRHTYTLQFLRH